MSAIGDLAARCKGAVYLTINAHRDVYVSVEAYLGRQRAGFDGTSDDIAPDVLREMVERNALVELQFYPDTPVGFYIVYHFDVDAAVAAALRIMDAPGRA